jgi:hypothetical protein
MIIFIKLYKKDIPLLFQIILTASKFSLLVSQTPFRSPGLGKFAPKVHTGKTLYRLANAR